MAATPEQRATFINAMINFAAPVAREKKLPAAALVACGAIESGYGVTRSSNGGQTIYDRTHCPFNLQKPDHYKWVHCKVVWLPTLSKMDASGKQSGAVKAPFCTAEGSTEQVWLADAARIWCEWVLGWPQIGVRNEMLALRNQPLEFARKLHRFGFGDPKVAKLTAQTYENVFREQRLIERCATEVAPTLLVPSWLPGWWRVNRRGQDFYYRFDAQYGVAWTQIAPLHPSFTPIGARDFGRVRINSNNDLSVTWNSSGSVENFTLNQAGALPTMVGRWNGSEQVSAERLW